MRQLRTLHAIRLLSHHCANPAYEAAKRTKFPEDDRIRVGIHAMLLFHYYWQMTAMMDKVGYEYLKEDFQAVEDAVCKVRNVTPEVAKKMAPHKPGYYSHLHEEDAYATADVVYSYWSNPDSLTGFKPGACTDNYVTTIKAIGA
ncbi:hypothetical protein G3N59_07920 [Paraburkholderia sp. Ac-20340]|uniref:hypothetical protein n=1 Tax=Paraburkholderia sp. Ac-20340 TaxID=2703888 RepID=UPI00197F8CC6|nr:hypothetical protein [Paraburkholderia sp. Ac-20340]MBN3853299.1 hypothetical protein [Paraburkholderia sp. Ac-20340]